MKTKILRIYKDICKINDDLIRKTDSIAPMCFLIKKDYNLIPVLCKFSDHDEKIALRKKLKQFILKLDILGYIIIFDTKMTMIDKKGKDPPKVVDAIIRTLYTPKEKKMEMVIYKDHKITKTIRLSKKDTRKTQDEWDLWGKGIDHDSLDKEFDYHKFKMENKGLYEGVIDQFDEYHQFRSEDGRIIIAYRIDHKEKAFRYYVPDDVPADQKRNVENALKQIMELNKATINYKIIKEVKK